MTVSANNQINLRTKSDLIDGAVPEEFKNPQGAFNEGEAPAWAEAILANARAALERHLTEGGPEEKSESPDCYRFNMVGHKWELTKSMAAEGWTQWQTTITTKSREDCAAQGVKYKKYRYACHFWVSPEREAVVLGKLKTQGKFIPGT